MKKVVAILLVTMVLSGSTPLVYGSCFWDCYRELQPRALSFSYGSN